MTYQQAKEQRDRLRADGVHCVVPKGYGPDGYFARIITRQGPFDMIDSDMVDAYLAESAKLRKAAELAGLRLTMRRPRSPLEAAIDKACGL